MTAVAVVAAASLAIVRLGAPASPVVVPKPSRGPYRMVAGLTPPRKVRHVNPVLPEGTRLAGGGNVVILELTVSASGRVEDVQVLRSVPGFDQAAIDAVRQWVYEPARLGDEPVSVIVTVTATPEVRR